MYCCKYSSTCYTALVPKLLILVPGACRQHFVSSSVSHLPYNHSESCSRDTHGGHTCGPIRGYLIPDVAILTFLNGTVETVSAAWFYLNAPVKWVQLVKLYLRHDNIPLFSPIISQKDSSDLWCKISSSSKPLKTFSETCRAVPFK